MRQSSSCSSSEPARHSTPSRSNPGKDLIDSRIASYQTLPAGRQQHVGRPLPRQWTSWTTDAETTSGPDSALTSERGLPRCKSIVDDASLLAGSKFSTQQQPPSESAAFFHAYQDSVKALPSRPKYPQELQYHRQSHGAAEEDGLRIVPKTQVENARIRPVPLNKPTSAVEVNVARSRCHPRRRPCSDAVSSTAPKLRRDTDCTEAIVRLIVYFSTKLVHTIWSQSSTTPKTSKDFNGAGVLPLQVFIQETLRRSKTSYSTLQVALYYLILLRPHVKPCQATQQQYTPGCRALQCGRRMFLTALILASKYLQDRNYSARAWSKISGLPVAEINENERHYLELIKYNLHMTKESFESWSKMVLSVCKASGQSQSGGKYESPPSSPGGLSCSSEFGRSGSSGWWLYHLNRLTPDMPKSIKTTEEYIAGLAIKAPLSNSELSLDTPPASPETLEEMLSSHGSPVVLPLPTSGPKTPCLDNLVSSEGPFPIGSVPNKPLPANLPTPQTTPRYDGAVMFSQRLSQPDVRCRASLQAMAGVDRQALNLANLETCPPPKPRHCSNVINSTMTHPLRESAEPSGLSWISSPESSFSDSSSSSTRSRSSSVSSISSVWSMPGQCGIQSDSKKPSLPRMATMPPCTATQPQIRSNIGSYSFYHPVGDMHPIPENATTGDQDCAFDRRPSSQGYYPVRPNGPKSAKSVGDLSDNQIAQLLASLSSRSNDQVQECTDPAAISTSDEPGSAKTIVEAIKKHKRARSSKGESTLRDEVRQLLWNEQVDVYVEDDKRPTRCVEAIDKQAQYPLQHWAHAKKPVPNAMHTKRIALQHQSSADEKSASDLAAEFLRQSVAVM